MKDFAPHPPIAGLRIVETLAGLDAIHASDCAGVIWARPDCPALSAWLRDLPAGRLPQTREILRPAGIPGALDRVCAALHEGPERHLFAESITALAERFAEVMGAPWLQMRLEVVTDNACRKFHLDNIRARLVCTYRGTGTQYGLAEGGAEPEVIYTVPTGQPFVMRGARWPTSPPSALKHRSPPIEGRGETRLLLVLDPVYAPTAL